MEHTPALQTRRRRKLLTVVQNLTLLISTAIVLTVQIAMLAITSMIMIDDLIKKSVVTADEMQDLLAEPLYNLDDSQVIRIGDALISSGRISGMTVDSAASGILYDRQTHEGSSSIPSLTRKIEYKGFHLGTVDLVFSDIEVILTRRRLMTVMAFIVAAVVIANLLANSLIVRKRVASPIAAIIQGIDAVAAGKYNSVIPVTGFTDVDSIIMLVNDMASKVQTKNIELKTLNDSLERRVEARTAELKVSLENLGLAQDRLIESSRLTALGRLSASIAHELNTPLGAILSSTSGLSTYLDGSLQDGVTTARALTDDQAILYNSVVAAAAPLSVNLELPPSGYKMLSNVRMQATEAGLADSNSIAESLMDMGIAARFSDISESLKIQGAAAVLDRAARDIAARRMAEIIDVAARKAASVVSALRSYLSPDSNNLNQRIEIDRELDKVLVLMNSLLRQGVTVQREYSAGFILGSPEQLSQVWMNLIRNALQAMEYSGTLTLRTVFDDKHATVSIIDTGSGIPDEVRNRIFDPFFSTKQHGEGMGLGLDICLKIVESHKGTIVVDSRPGHTEFAVILPVAGAS